MDDVLAVTENSGRGWKEKERTDGNNERKSKRLEGIGTLRYSEGSPYGGKAMEKVIMKLNAIK